MLILKMICLFSVLFFAALGSNAQTNDSIKISVRPKSKKAIQTPEIKANIQSYKPAFSTFGSNNLGNLSNKSVQPNTIKDKLLNVVKIFPNPVESQINIILSLTRDTPISYKIIDILGNEVLTLANEHLSAGDQTRSFSLPNRLNPGIYFLRIIAGSESQIKRISIL